jgi:class 3 adenylate cyclase|tara:strand:- start:585 stop:815 length:231 start_codon:yes stop_codon:yes gene_type:complete
MVTTLNDRLDYFGSTVHATHRLLDLAEAGDLMVTDAVAASREVSELLEDATDTAAVVSANLIDGSDLANVIVQRYR